MKISGSSLTKLNKFVSGMNRKCSWPWNWSLATQIQFGNFFMSMYVVDLGQNIIEVEDNF